MPTHLRKSGLPARTEREFGTTLVATAQRASLARSWLHSALTIHSSRRRFAARLNSGVRSSWSKTLKLVNRAYLRASCGCDVGHRERLAPLSRSTFLAALTGHPRQAAVALPSLATRKVMGQSRPNNSFKPTPLRGAA